MYSIEVRDRDGMKLGVFENAFNISFSKRLNDYGQCSFSVPYNDGKLETLLSLRRYLVYVKKEDTIVWGGEQAVWNVDLTANIENDIKINSYEFLEKLRYRVCGVNVVYEQVDAGQIAWDLIDIAQNESNGDMGLIEGTIEPTMLRDRTYKNEDLYKIIVNLTNVLNGFDIEITPERVVNIYQHKGMAKPYLVLEYGRNIERCSIVSDFRNPANRAIVLGESYGESQTRVIREDISMQEAVEIREVINNEPNIVENETFEEKGDAILRKFKNPVLSLDVSQLTNTEPVLGSIDIGDSIRIKIKTIPLTIDNMMRVYGYDVDIDDETGAERISYLVGLL